MPRVSFGLEESARSGPLILLADRRRPDPDPSVHSTLKMVCRGVATSLPIAKIATISPSISRKLGGGVERCIFSKIDGEESFVSLWFRGEE